MGKDLFTQGISTLTKQATGMTSKMTEIVKE